MYANMSHHTIYAKKHNRFFVPINYNIWFRCRPKA